MTRWLRGLARLMLVLTRPEGGGKFSPIGRVPIDDWATARK